MHIDASQIKLDRISQIPALSLPLSFCIHMRSSFYPHAAAAAHTHTHTHTHTHSLSHPHTHPPIQPCIHSRTTGMSGPTHPSPPNQHTHAQTHTPACCSCSAQPVGSPRKPLGAFGSACKQTNHMSKKRQITRQKRRIICQTTPIISKAVTNVRRDP